MKKVKLTGINIDNRNNHVLISFSDGTKAGYMTNNEVIMYFTELFGKDVYLLYKDDSIILPIEVKLYERYSTEIKLILDMPLIPKVGQTIKNQAMIEIMNLVKNVK